MEYTHQHLVHIPNNNENERGERGGILAGLGDLLQKPVS